MQKRVNDDQIQVRDG